MQRITFTLLLYLSISACSVWEDVPYEVISTDGYVRLVKNLNYDGPIGKVKSGGSIGRVSGNIIAVGSNDKYVVAKRKQDKSFAKIDKEPLTDELMYYYIDRNKDDTHGHHDEVVKGPFTLAEFSKLKNSLDLPELTKTIE